LASSWNTWTPYLTKYLYDDVLSKIKYKENGKLCEDKENNTLEKCRDISVERTNYGYPSGCIWNNFGPLSTPSPN